MTDPPFKRIMIKRSVPVLFAFLTLSCSSLPLAGTEGSDALKPQNVVFFVADGCGPASFSLARDYQRVSGNGDTLFLDAFERGSVMTYSGNHRITDSAASATAYSCAIKTYNGAIGVDMDRQPVETILEAAEKAGYNTGLISTARITHATPAAFSSHVVDRSMEAQIADQQLEKGIELIMGGGTMYYLPKEAGGGRTDGKNLLDAAVSAGYTSVSNRNEMLAADTLPLIGLFTAGHMAYEIDRDTAEEPSIAEMTTKALELLDNAEKPFFIMIEAGRIDHAGHENDTAAHLHDILAYDEAMRAAVKFARLDEGTLVVGTSDHETGGLTLGAETNGKKGSGYAYDPLTLNAIDWSVNRFSKELRASMARNDEVLPWMFKSIEEHYGLSSEAFQNEVRKIVQYRSVVGESAALVHLNHLLRDSTAAAARVGWSTGGHTAINVPMYAFGPGSEAFTGVMDNTEVGLALQRALGLN